MGKAGCHPKYLALAGAMVPVLSLYIQSRGCIKLPSRFLFVCSLRAMMIVTYDDGQTMVAGDAVLISGQYHGVVVANIDSRSYQAGEEGWAYLLTGVMIRNGFAGLVCYQDNANESFELVARNKV